MTTIHEIDLEKWMKVVEVTVNHLKTRFPNLTADEAIKLAHRIVASIRLELEK